PARVTVGIAEHFAVARNHFRGARRKLRADGIDNAAFDPAPVEVGHKTLSGRGDRINLPMLPPVAARNMKVCVEDGNRAEAPPGWFGRGRRTRGGIAACRSRSAPQ